MRECFSMRVALIEPAAPGFHVYSFQRLPRLGLPLIGALLRERGHEVRIYCEALGQVDWSYALSADVVGISTITSTAVRAYNYARQTTDAGIPTIMGGSHVSFLADEALCFCDYVVRGEGEDTLLELVSYLGGPERSSSLTDIKGLSFRDERGRVVHNPPRENARSLGHLPQPDLSLIVGHEHMPVLPVVASRGCPYACDFCSVVTMFGRRVRTARPEQVVGYLKRLRPKKVFFCDDNFFISERWGRELLHEMVRQQLEVPFFAQARADTFCRNGRVDWDLLRLMRRAGWDIAYLGLESTDAAALDGFHKQTKLGDMVGGIEALQRAGIKVHGMFIFGADSDTPESFSRTVDFALRQGLSSAQFLALTPLPGTPLMARLEAEGRIFTYNWTLYDTFHVVFRPKNMTPLELQTSVLEANRRFYTAGRILALGRSAPVRRLHRLQGYLISRAWEHVTENADYLCELSELSRVISGEGSARFRPWSEILGEV
jgi:radical SAM superfamily enzyme YgiQ (UPF0313 family)